MLKNRWLVCLGALLFLALAWAMLVSRPAPACATDQCNIWICEEDDQCGDGCVCKDSECVRDD